MLKTATITWNSFYNFGTCLQAFALQKFIESMGCSNKIIDDSTIVAPLAVQTSLWQRIVFKCTYYVTKIVRLFSPKYNAFYKMQRVLIQKTNSFKRDMLNIDYNICSVINDETDYDLFICGSDQVWNPMVLEDNRRLFYYANFTTKSKISYAPSLGVVIIPEKWKAKIKELLSSFSAIAVREETGRIALQSIVDIPIQVVVDPTLLLSKSDWEQYVPMIKNEESYVLAYFLTYNASFFSAVRKYAHEHNCKLYMFYLNPSYYKEADKMIMGGPFDFLSYIKGAKAFFTDSFHGTIFSTIFEVPFYTFERFKNETIQNQNSRIENLLSLMGAQSRLFNEENMSDIYKNEDIDFKQYKENLNSQICFSKQYLADSFSKF